MSDTYIDLQAWQVASAAALILVNAAVSFKLQLGLERTLALASIRTVIQLLLVGMVLHWVFELNQLAVIVAIMVTMTLIAGVTAWSRAGHRYPGMLVNVVVSIWGSAWLILAFTMAVVFRQTQPWYDPQYAIPLLGMILGNTLNGITLGLGSVVDALSTRQREVETLLALGATRWEAARGLIQHSVRVGMIPIINSMMVVGLVSLPGMMTGQLLSGVEPLAAVRYQIVIMFVIASATALGVVAVVILTLLRISNSQHQFCFDEIVETPAGRGGGVTG
jgi:putative ABC transport system permease protein